MKELFFRSVGGVATALLLVSSVVRIDLYLQESGEMEPGTALSIVEELADAIGKNAGVKPSIQVGAPCSFDDRICIRNLLTKNDARALVIVRAFRGIRRIGVAAERYDSSGAPTSAEAFVAADAPDSWRAELDPIAETLFPQPLIVVQAPPPTITRQQETDSKSVGPWITMGLGVVAAGVGIGFGVSSRNAREELQTRTLELEEYRDLNNRMRTHGTIANVFFGASVAALVGGITWLVLEE